MFQFTLGKKFDIMNHGKEKPMFLDDQYLAYDTKLYRPGCVLIQASLGGSTEIAMEFPTELWLLAPTDDMKLYPIANKEFLDRLIALSIEKN